MSDDFPELSALLRKKEIESVVRDVSRLQKIEETLLQIRKELSFVALILLAIAGLNLIALFV